MSGLVNNILILFCKNFFNGFANSRKGIIKKAIKKNIPTDVNWLFGAGEENRTLTVSLEG